MNCIGVFKSKNALAKPTKKSKKVAFGALKNEVCVATLAAQSR
jgi:hypothetical protein